MRREGDEAMARKVDLNSLVREVPENFPEEDRVQAVFQALLPELSRRHADLLHRVAREEERRDQIRVVLRREVAAHDELTPEEQAELLRRLIAHTLGLGMLDGPYQDPKVSEVQLNPDGRIFVVREGRLEPAEARFPELAAGMDAQEAFRFFQGFFGDIDRPLSPEEPVLDGWLPDDSRINAVFAPAVRGGPAITIRKSPKIKEAPTVRTMLRDGCLSRAMAAFLACAVRGHLNLMIVGPPGAGKTTLMSVLLGFVPSCERVISAQDVLELQLPPRLRNHVELVTVERGGEERIPMHRLVQAMLRMTPSRGILVEVRGRETVDYINLCSVGTRGNITSIHGYTPEDARRRVYMEFQKAGVGISREDCYDLFHQATDLVAVCLRSPDGRYRLARITEVLPEGGFQDLFVYDPAADRHQVVASLSAARQEHINLWWGVRLPRCLRDPAVLEEWERRQAAPEKGGEEHGRMGRGSGIGSGSPGGLGDRHGAGAHPAGALEPASVGVGLPGRHRRLRGGLAGGAGVCQRGGGTCRGALGGRRAGPAARPVASAARPRTGRGGR